LAPRALRLTWRALRSASRALGACAVLLSVSVGRSGISGELAGRLLGVKSSAVATVHPRLCPEEVVGLWFGRAAPAWSTHVGSMSSVWKAIQKCCRVWCCGAIRRSRRGSPWWPGRRAYRAARPAAIGGRVWSAGAATASVQCPSRTDRHCGARWAAGATHFLAAPARRPSLLRARLGPHRSRRTAAPRSSSGCSAAASLCLT
jgi:hypothetical protein